jgi:hypothetical protein
MSAGHTSEPASGGHALVVGELWVSFVALIRSYVAGHDLAKPVSEHALVDEGEGGHLTLRGDGRTLELEFDAANGAGSWTVYEDDPGPDRVLERGTFEIGEDSRVALSDRVGKLDLEVAAEAFTAKVFEE